MSPDHYDAQLRIRAVVPAFDAYVERYRTLSSLAREHLRCHLDCSYGASSLERCDVFRPDDHGNRRPVHVFFHGGYWRAFDKADYSFVARSIVEAGAIAVIANYGLMPTISMAELIAQCQRLICWVYEHAERLGADPRCISVSGHSAGAHIATVLHFTTWGAHGMPADLIKSTVAVSGIFDLGPVFHSFLRAETGINAENVARFSPMSWLGREENHRAPLLLAVGADETEEFQRQSAEFSLVLHTMGINSPVLRIGRRHHMDIVLDLGDASSELGRNLVRHIQTI